MCYRCILLLTACMVFGLELRSQAIITGRVLDMQESPVGNASVSYRVKEKVAVLGYTMSKSDGSFRLESTVLGVDSIELTVSHLSYQKIQRVIANNTATHTFKLTAGSTELREVSVAPFPIYKRRDTINYVVDAFTSRQDRVIGDIIKKLPGIEVINGRIHYQGKLIQKYMVNNLDLMEGRYGMINDNLPADAVKNVQVVENDQPIKILDSLVASDRASLNLELKNPVTATGTGRVGVGAVPALWQLDFTPMVFSKSFQSLTSLHSNNIGDDVAQNLKPFYTGGTLFRTSLGNSEGTSYLSVSDISSPDLNQKKWLDNQLFLASANVLQKLKNDFEVKGNISYYADRRMRSGVATTNVFAPNQHVLLTEAVDNRNRIHDLSGGVLVEKNEKNVYLRNRLSYHKRWNREAGVLTLNHSDAILQENDRDDYSVQNSLSLARFIGKQLVTIQSDVEFGETPQQLTVLPGQFADALNGGLPYDRLQQRVNLGKFRMNNDLSFLRKLGWWSITPSLAINYQSTSLQTGIVTDDDGAANPLGVGYRNDMSARRGELAVGTYVQYARGPWELTGTLPYSFLVFDVEQQGEQPVSREGKSVFNPSAMVRYALDSRQTLSANTAYSRRFEDMDYAYNAYIATTYRSIQRYSARLLGNNVYDAGIAYKYSNTLSGVFTDASYAYTSRTQDYLFRTSIDSLGRAVVDIADHHGKNEAHTLSVGYGHFFQLIKTVAKLRINASRGQGDYLLNNILATRGTRSLDGSVELNCSNWDFLGITYKLEMGSAKTLLALGESNAVIYRNHLLQASVHANERHSFHVQHSYYRNNMPGLQPQHFLDGSYIYHLKRWKTDIVLTGQNLLNNARYSQRFSNDYRLVETYFELRPRQFLVTTRFRF